MLISMSEIPQNADYWISRPLDSRFAIDPNFAIAAACRIELSTLAQVTCPDHAKIVSAGSLHVGPICLLAVFVRRFRLGGLVGGLNDLAT